MSKIVYVITNDPEQRCELVSSVFAQALVALSFGHSCEIYLMDDGVHIVENGRLDGLTSAFGSMSELLQNFKELGGKLLACIPAMAARSVNRENCIPEVDDYVNAPALIESSITAGAVFTF